jgi:hypothetical protein
MIQSGVPSDWVWCSDLKILAGSSRYFHSHASARTPALSTVNRKQVFADRKGQAQKGCPAHMQQTYIAALLSVGLDLRQVL